VLRYTNSETTERCNAPLPLSRTLPKQGPSVSKPASHNDDDDFRLSGIEEIPRAIAGVVRMVRDNAEAIAGLHETNRATADAIASIYEKIESSERWARVFASMRLCYMLVIAGLFTAILYFGPGWAAEQIVIEAGKMHKLNRPQVPTVLVKDHPHKPLRPITEAEKSEATDATD